MPNGFWNQSLPFTLNYGSPMSMFGPGAQGSGFMGLGGLGMPRQGANPFSQGFMPNRRTGTGPAGLGATPATATGMPQTTMPNPNQDPNPLNRPWLPWSGLKPGQTVFGGKTSMPEWTTSGPGAYWGIPTGTTEGTLATGPVTRRKEEVDLEKRLLEAHLKSKGLSKLPENVGFGINVSYAPGY